MAGRPKIAKLEKKRDVAGLIAALETGEDGVAQAATAALSRLGGAEATAGLVLASAHGSPEVRLLAAKGLSGNGQADFVAPLARMARIDPYEPAQLEAIAALRRAGTDDALDALTDVATAAPDGSRGREAARRALLDLGSAAVPHLVTRLDAGTEQATAAALLLGEIGDPAAVEPITRALEEGPPDPDACIAALSVIGTDQAVDTLIVLLHWGGEDVSRSAAVGLERHTATPRVITALVKAASAPSDITRAAAVVGLAAAPDDVDDVVVETLRGALRDPAFEVRQEAAGVLIRRGYRGTDVVDALVAQLNTATSWTEEARAAHLLGMAGDVRALDVLNRMLESTTQLDDHSFPVRDAARVAITRIKISSGAGPA
jgi:HEAT repeat protein